MSGLASTLPTIELWFAGEPIREEIVRERPELARPEQLGRSPGLGYAFAERIDAQLRNETGEYWRTNPEDGSGTRGGGLFDLVQLVVNDAASWITVGIAIAAGMKWLSRRGGTPAEIGEGAALVIARNAVYERTSLDDLSPSFTTRVGSRPEPDLPDGWAVALRSDTDLWIVVVDNGGTEHGFASIGVDPIMGPASW